MLCLNWPRLQSVNGDPTTWIFIKACKQWKLNKLQMLPDFKPLEAVVVIYSLARNFLAWCLEYWASKCRNRVWYTVVHTGAYRAVKVGATSCDTEKIKRSGCFELFVINAETPVTWLSDIDVTIIITLYDMLGFMLSLLSGLESWCMWKTHNLCSALTLI